MVEVLNITKKYGQHLAVSNASFTVNKGEIVGLLGPNGAGKTTTMNIITGCLSANEGTVKIGGFDMLDKPIEAKRLLGYLPEIPPVYTDLTVLEYLNFVYGLKKCKLDRAAHIKEITDKVRLTPMMNRLIGNLSKGYRQRVGIAQALIGSPPVIILDEPTAGLDPKEIVEIRNFIKDLGKTKTVIISSHILPEIQVMCERIIVINQGKIVADSTTEEITKEATKNLKMSVRVVGRRDEIARVLKSIPGVRNVFEEPALESEAYDFTVESDENIDVRKPLVKTLADKNMSLLMLKPLELSLEEAFIRLVDNSDDKNTKNVKKKNKLSNSERIKKVHSKGEKQ